MNRNDVVEGIQGNRNVFIDYPEYAWLLFGKDVPDDISTPSASASDTSAPSTPGVTPGQDSECTHDFDDWDDVGDGQKMRICLICSEVEFAPQEDISEPETNNSSTPVLIACASVTFVGVGAFVFVCVKKKKANR